MVATEMGRQCLIMALEPLLSGFEKYNHSQKKRSQIAARDQKKKPGLEKAGLDRAGSALTVVGVNRRFGRLSASPDPRTPRGRPNRNTGSAAPRVRGYRLLRVPVAAGHRPARRRRLLHLP